ncbi:MAG: hypothetical protein HFJ09_07185 [Lachnospiraceae bacterium]|nr:hypothetical protein [Lachnospiraceae bacterium]
MLELLDNIFRENKFYEYEIKKIVKNEFVKKIYTNEFDDMYMIMETELNENTLNELLEVSQEVYETDTVEKAKKSNWVMILLVKQKEYIANQQDHISDKQRKLILNIEENQYYCRKYILWYAEEERAALEAILDGNYTIKNISGILQNYNYFCEFKENANKGYDLLTRMCIKLPFWNLSDIEGLDMSIEDMLREKVNVLADGLFDLLVEKNSVDTLLEKIQLSEKDEREIEKKIKELESE